MAEKIQFGKFLLEVKAIEKDRDLEIPTFVIYKTDKGIDEEGNGYNHMDCLNREELEELIKDGIKYRESKNENQ